MPLLRQGAAGVEGAPDAPRPGARLPRHEPALQRRGSHGAQSRDLWRRGHAFLQQAVPQDVACRAHGVSRGDAFHAHRSRWRPDPTASRSSRTTCAACCAWRRTRTLTSRSSAGASRWVTSRRRGSFRAAAASPRNHHLCARAHGMSWAQGAGRVARGGQPHAAQGPQHVRRRWVPVLVDVTSRRLAYRSHHAHARTTFT